MSLFDVYIGIDFSGSKDVSRQKSSIAVAECVAGSKSETITNQFTRFEVVWHVLQRILHHNSKGRRVMCGFDFCYAFPSGLWSALTGAGESWTDMIRGLADGAGNLPAISEKPESNARRWAELANRAIAGRVEVSTGPFWGPGFAQSKDPSFPFSRSPFGQFRIVEKKKPSFKPIFKIGGQGSVGLQSLCGIPYLHHIRTTCSQQKVPLLCWPFDGWDPKGSNHIIAEMYPALYNQGPKSHESDASAFVDWAGKMDESGHLLEYFLPELSDDEKATAAVEGWVLGIT